MHLGYSCSSELQNRAPEGGSVENLWTADKIAFIVAGENLGELRTQEKLWITNENQKKIEEWKNAKTTLERATTRGAKAESRQRYSVLEKEVKYSCDGTKVVNEAANPSYSSKSSFMNFSVYQCASLLRSSTKEHPNRNIEQATWCNCYEPALIHDAFIATIFHKRKVEAVHIFEINSNSDGDEIVLFEETYSLDISCSIVHF